MGELLNANEAGAILKSFERSENDGNCGSKRRGGKEGGNGPESFNTLSQCGTLLPCKFKVFLVFRPREDRESGVHKKSPAIMLRNQLREALHSRKDCKLPLHVC